MNNFVVTVNFTFVSVCLKIVNISLVWCGCVLSGWNLLQIWIKLVTTIIKWHTIVSFFHTAPNQNFNFHSFVCHTFCECSVLPWKYYQSKLVLEFDTENGSLLFNSWETLNLSPNFSWFTFTVRFFFSDSPWRSDIFLFIWFYSLRLI